MAKAPKAQAQTIQSLGIVVFPYSVLTLFLTTVFSPTLVAIRSSPAFRLKAIARELLFAAGANLIV
jgi:hypothetical protein